MYSLLLLLIANLLYTMSHALQIKPITEAELKDAYTVICESAFELHLVPGATVQETIKYISSSHLLADMEDMKAVEQAYTNNNGCLLVVVDKENTVGVGAVKKFDAHRCEITRMFITPSHRGLGFGTKLLEKLLGFAINTGYQQALLNVWNPPLQNRAIQLYEKHGFIQTTPYKECSAKLFMEKTLIKSTNTKN